MTPPRAVSADRTQTPGEIAAAIETFVEEHPKAVVLEDGKVAFGAGGGQLRNFDRTWAMHAADVVE